jgi:hypothetical protein
MTRWSLFLALTTWMAMGQTPTARITGVVSDESGAVVPGAAVSMQNLKTGQSFSTTANQSGLYGLPYLEPGSYRMEAQANGFRRYVRPKLAVETGRVISLDITLQIGESSESVTVKAEAPLLQSDTSSITQTIENANVISMPLASRRSARLVALMGNVTFGDENEGDAGIVNFSMAGGRSRQQQWLWDGGNLQGVTLFTGVIQLSPPVEAIQELHVEVNAYPAEYGRSTGGVISMTTKSGTNEFHGVLYGFHRNDALDARNFFAAAKAPRKYTVFGATLGGPVKKDRTFFFFSYEGARRRDASTRIYNLPTDPEKRGDFSARSGTLIDPVTRTPFPGNIIPSSRFDRIGSAFAQLYPSPNVPGAASGANNFRINIVDKVRADTYIARADHTFNQNDRISIRYTGYDTPFRAGRVFSRPEADPSGSDSNQRQFHLMGTWIHVFSPKFLSETRLLYSRRSNDNPLPFPSTFVKDVGLTGVADTTMPTVSLIGLTGLGPGNQLRLVKPQQTVNIGQTFSWYSGKHTVKFGGDWRRSLVDDQFGTSQAGAFSFNDISTGPGFSLAALLLGRPVSASVSAGATSLRSDYFAAFIQDDWKIAPKLSLNIGIRWDLETPRLEQQNRQSGFDAVPINPVSGTAGVVTFAGLNGVSRYAHNFDVKNLGPRFGFSWKPLSGDKTVIRGGYGWMTGSIYDASLTTTNIAGFGEARSFASPDNGLTPAFILANGVPTPPKEALGPAFGAVAVGQSVRLSPQFFDRNHRSPYAHQYNLTVQHQIISTLMLETAYIANLSHRIGGPGVNINEVRPELRGAVQNQTLRPFPQFGNVTWLSPNWGNSSYHSMNLKLEKRLSGGFNLLANYTWSKFLDDIEANSEAGGAPGSGQQSYYARHLDKSRSGNDIRHRLIASSVMELPFGAGRRWKMDNIVADAIVGGWNFGLTTEFSSGLPFGVIEATNRLNAFSPSQRPNLIASPALASDRPRSEQVRQWFSTTAFAFPGAGVLGNAARTVGDGPGLINVDVSMLKDFRITEKRYLQLRGEFYNLFNRPNFGLPNGSRGVPAFGTINSTRTPGRQIQIGARFVF